MSDKPKNGHTNIELPGGINLRDYNAGLLGEFKLKNATQSVMGDLINSKAIKEIDNQVIKAMEEKEKREQENSENLKSVAESNDRLVMYNQQLVDLNSKMLNRIDTTVNTLDMMLNNIGQNAQTSEQLDEQQIKLMHELNSILSRGNESKRGKLKEFFSSMAGDASVALLIEFIKMYLLKTP